MLYHLYIYTVKVIVGRSEYDTDIKQKEDNLSTSFTFALRALMPFTIKCCDVADKLFIAELLSGRGCINKNKARHHKQFVAQCLDGLCDLKRT